MTYFEHWYCFG